MVFADDFAVFSAQGRFTAVNGNTTDVELCDAGSTTAATPAATTALGAVFTDRGMAGLSKIDCFEESGGLLCSRSVPSRGNQGLSLLGTTASSGSVNRAAR